MFCETVQNKFKTPQDQSITAKMARDNDNRKGGDKPKRRGNHNQGGNRNNFFRGHASKQNKAVLTLDPVPEPTKTTSVKILDKMGNEAKEKLPNFRDDNNGALLVELCEKAITLYKTYNLYDENGDWKAVTQAQHRAMYGECKKTRQELMGNTRNYGMSGANKHKKMCQQLCQEELGEQVTSTSAP